MRIAQLGRACKSRQKVSNFQIWTKVFCDMDVVSVKKRIHRGVLCVIASIFLLFSVIFSIKAQESNGKISYKTIYSSWRSSDSKLTTTTTISAQNQSKLNWNVPKKNKIILGWTPFFSSSFLEMWTRKEQCPESRCDVSMDRALLNEADAILFHIINMNWNDLPAVRSRQQRYVFVLLESPAHSPGLLSGMNFFNWTMTYRRDADIYMPYGRMTAILEAEKRLSRTELFAKLTSVVRDKTKMIAWFVGNCKTQSERETYVNALQQYVPVDVYGLCGPLRCDNCHQMLYTDYKFYLAFENSVCTDYITEKFWKWIQSLVVPIVLRRRDYEFVAPKHSFIAVDDFSSGAQLAAYLKFLDANTTQYLEYFAWRSETQAQTISDMIPEPPRPATLPTNTIPWGTNLCALCEKLHSDDDENKEKVYTDIHKWWHEMGDCQEGYAETLLQMEKSIASSTTNATAPR